MLSEAASISARDWPSQPIGAFLSGGVDSSAVVGFMAQSSSQPIRTYAIGFEGGLVAFLVPVFAWWLGVSLWESLVMDLGLVVFFLVYTFVFNWSFDRLFGLPTSAAPRAQPA